MAIGSPNDSAGDVNVDLSNDEKPNDVDGANQDAEKVHTESEHSSSLFPESIIEEEKFDPNLGSAIKGKELKETIRSEHNGRCSVILSPFP